MKKLLTMLVMAVSVSASGELIQSVSYNPTRHGQYERLNINHKINVPGGLRAVKGGGSGSLTLSSPVYAMKQMKVNGNATLTSACLTNGSCSSGEGSAMQLKGGTVTVKGDSYIAEVVSASTVKAKTLSVPNVTVKQSIKLGSGTISKPSDISNCSNWTWKGVTAASGATHKVLALAGCQASTGCNKPAAEERCNSESHGGAYGQWNSVTCSCDCPPGLIVDSDGQCDCPTDLKYNTTTGKCEDPCAANLADKERCEGGHIRGTWQTSTCSCKCPDGYAVDPRDGECSEDCPYILRTIFARGYGIQDKCTDDPGDCNPTANRSTAWFGNYCVTCEQDPMEYDLIVATSVSTCRGLRYDSQDDSRDYDCGDWGVPMGGDCDGWTEEMDRQQQDWEDRYDDRDDDRDDYWDDYYDDYY